MKYSDRYKYYKKNCIPENYHEFDDPFKVDLLLLTNEKDDFLNSLLNIKDKV